MPHSDHTDIEIGNPDVNVNSGTNVTPLQLEVVSDPQEEAIVLAGNAVSEPLDADDKVSIAWEVTNRGQDLQVEAINLLSFHNEDLEHGAKFGIDRTQPDTDFLVGSGASSIAGVDVNEKNGPSQSFQLPTSFHWPRHDDMHPYVEYETTGGTAGANMQLNYAVYCTPTNGSSLDL